MITRDRALAIKLYGGWAFVLRGKRGVWCEVMVCLGAPLTYSYVRVHIRTRPLYYREAASTRAVQLPSVGRLCTRKRVVHAEQWLTTLSYYLGFALGFVLGFVLGLVPEFVLGLVPGFVLVQHLFYVTNPSGHDPLPRPDHGWGAAYKCIRPSLRGPLLDSAT